MSRDGTRAVAAGVNGSVHYVPDTATGEDVALSLGCPSPANGVRRKGQRQATRDPAAVGHGVAPQQQQGSRRRVRQGPWQGDSEHLVALAMSADGRVVAGCSTQALGAPGHVGLAEHQRRPHASGTERGQGRTGGP